MRMMLLRKRTSLECQHISGHSSLICSGPLSLDTHIACRSQLVSPHHELVALMMICGRPEHAPVTHLSLPHGRLFGCWRREPIAHTCCPKKAGTGRVEEGGGRREGRQWGTYQSQCIVETVWSIYFDCAGIDDDDSATCNVVVSAAPTSLVSFEDAFVLQL